MVSGNPNSSCKSIGHRVPLILLRHVGQFRQFLEVAHGRLRKDAAEETGQRVRVREGIRGGGAIRTVSPIGATVLEIRGHSFPAAKARIGEHLVILVLGHVFLLVPLKGLVVSECPPGHLICVMPRASRGPATRTEPGEGTASQLYLIVASFHPRPEHPSLFVHGIPVRDPSCLRGVEMDHKWGFHSDLSQDKSIMPGRVCVGLSCGFGGFSAGSTQTPAHLFRIFVLTGPSPFQQTPCLVPPEDSCPVISNLKVPCSLLQGCRVFVILRRWTLKVLSEKGTTVRGRFITISFSR